MIWQFCALVTLNAEDCSCGKDAHRNCSPAFNTRMSMPSAYTKCIRFMAKCKPSVCFCTYVRASMCACACVTMYRMH